jgi:hypothetical protein
VTKFIINVIKIQDIKQLILEYEKITNNIDFKNKFNEFVQQTTNDTGLLINSRDIIKFFGKLTIQVLNNG